jgi:hypothetical protein
VIPGDARYRPCEAEVDLVLEVPLFHLLDPSLRRTEQREALGRVYEVDFYTYDTHVIWGATARILRELLAQVADLSQARSAAAR